MCILTFYLEVFLFAFDTSCMSYFVLGSKTVPLPINILQNFFFLFL